MDSNNEVEKKNSQRGSYISGQETDSVFEL